MLRLARRSAVVYCPNLELDTNCVVDLMSTDEPKLSPSTGLIVTAVAVIVAAAPHVFFAPPLQLHMEGQMQAWLGIAVWAPAILAGVGFFFGVEFGSRDDRRDGMDPAVRAAVLVVAVLAYVMLAAVLHVDRWTDMAAMRPWGHLQTALPLFAGLGVLRAVFWQGFVQHKVLTNMASGARVAALCGLELVVAAPYLMSGDTTAVATGLLPLVAAEAMLGATAHELGYPVRVSILVRAIAGASFIWLQQALLL